MLKVLECSEKGDKRFSANHAMLSANGKRQTIAEHYEFAKRFKGEAPSTVAEAQGKECDYFVVQFMTVDKEHLSKWYSLLWLWYLDSNPHLVAEISNCDVFVNVHEFERGDHSNIIETYIKQGKEVAYDEIRDFLEMVGGK